MTRTTSEECHVHKPMIRALMTYSDKNGKRQAHLIQIGDARGEALIQRTIRYAMHNGIEVTIRPA